jgi:predicted RNA-binding protein (TIGR00451 family)
MIFPKKKTLRCIFSAWGASVSSSGKSTFQDIPLLVLTYVYISSDPEIMKKFQVDRGAIRFVLSGANIMCPGLTSPGGALDNEVEEETPVVQD